jgi:serine/threonine protein kinase
MLYFQFIHLIIGQGNIFLDSEFHCQITDFGLTRHSEATTTQSTAAVAYRFAAPELFGLCLSCNQPDCDGCGGSSGRKTMQTDVYAFGCLYYAVRLLHPRQN